MAGSVTENVTKLSFASERMQAAERAHNFVVDFCLQTTSTVVEVSRCRSPFRPMPSRLTPGLWRRWDVEQSPFTVVYTGPCGRRPPLLSKAPRISS